MPESKLIVPSTYADLVRAVNEALIRGQTLADRAYLETYHRTGQLIDAHLSANKARAGYGSRVIPRLAESLHADERQLYRCLRFYREYPILVARPELTWAHYRLLLDVADKARRTALEKQASKQHWTSDELQTRVRALNAVDVTPAKGDDSAAPKLLTPKRGTPGVCRVLAADGGLVVDLGFACYLDLPDDTGLSAGNSVQLGSKVSAPSSQLSALDSGYTKSDLFTYHAAVLKVVDGDTLWVKIYLRPGQWVKQKLRLRDLDCPEIATPEGKAAKRFVDPLVARATAVTVCTTKPDKYDRYLADVFLTQPDGEEVFLNNALLTAGHAVPKKAWQFGDWGE